jgi:hypothetical protein
MAAILAGGSIGFPRCEVPTKTSSLDATTAANATAYAKTLNGAISLASTVPISAATPMSSACIHAAARTETSTRLVATTPHIETSASRAEAALPAVAVHLNRGTPPPLHHSFTRVEIFPD